MIFIRNERMSNMCLFLPLATCDLRMACRLDDVQT